MIDESIKKLFVKSLDYGDTFENTLEMYLPIYNMNVGIFYKKIIILCTLCSLHRK